MSDDALVVRSDGGTVPLSAYFDANDDPCFGVGFSSGADECRECTMAVIVNERMTTCRELCRERSDPKARFAVPMTYRDVAERLLAGATRDEIVQEMAGTDDPDVVAAARQTVSARYAYMRKKGVDPDVL